MSQLLLMSQRELSRLEVFRQLLDKRLRQRQAAALLGLSVRQVIRLSKAFRREGASALVSKRRGRPSNNRLAEEVLGAALSRPVAGGKRERTGVAPNNPWRVFDYSEKSLAAREKRGELCILRK